MNKPTPKTIIFGGINVDEKVVETLLNGDKTKFRILLESIGPQLEELCTVSNVLKKEEPMITQISTTTKSILQYIVLLENALKPIPKGLSATELMNNEDIKERLMARNRLKNMKIEGFIQLLSTLVSKLEEIILLHNNPNLLYKDTKLDETDLSILMNRSLVLSDFERRQMNTSISEFDSKTDGDDEHGVLVPLFKKTRENVENKEILVKFETLYDEVQNCCSLAEDLLIKEEGE